MTKVDTIKHIYERFAHNDGAAILATFDENIEFRLAEGHPYAESDGTPWIGGDAIAQSFFKRAAAEWRDWTFHVHEIIETSDAVVIEGRYSADYEPTGRHLDAQACHVWRFRDGRIASFHQYVDTARVQHVMGLPLWPPHQRPTVFPGVPVSDG